MDLKKISADFSVAPQITPEDVGKARQLGFVSIINNRPDLEEASQPSAELMGVAVGAEGLSYQHQPVVSGNITDNDINEFRRLFDSAPKPLLAFCRTGTRCTMLWALANARVDNIDELISDAANAGYDISALKPRMQLIAEQLSA